MDFGNLAPGGGAGQQGLDLLKQVQAMKARPGNQVGLLAQLMPQAGAAGPAGAAPAAGSAPSAGGMPAFLQNGLLGQLMGGMKGMGSLFGGGQPGAPMNIAPPAAAPMMPAAPQSVLPALY